MSSQLPAPFQRQLTDVQHSPAPAQGSWLHTGEDSLGELQKERRATDE